jgi:glutathione S-transferase
MHPLASFCHKALIALYENDTPFHPHLVDLADQAARAAFYALWPMGRFPLLRDDARDCLVPESSIIIEYLAQHYPGKVALVPQDADLAREVRLRDRFFDLYVNEAMQKVVTDRPRPSDDHDHYGVSEARHRLRTAYDLLEKDMATRTWAMGDSYTMADCSASPALFYANMVMPLDESHPHTAAYLLRLMQRPSFERVLREAQPYMHMLPREAADA